MRALTALLAASALAACGGATDPSEDQAAPDIAEAVANEAPGEATPANDAAPDPAPPATAIPAALQGRWGLVPGDCTSTRGDAKGLLTVGAEELRFYESRARISRLVESAPTRVTADFAFSGEGMEWQRRMTLEATGDTLVRSESGEGAAPEPLRYARCA